MISVPVPPAKLAKLLIGGDAALQSAVRVVMWDRGNQAVFDGLLADWPAAWETTTQYGQAGGYTIALLPEQGHALWAQPGAQGQVSLSLVLAEPATQATGQQTHLGALISGQLDEQNPSVSYQLTVPFDQALRIRQALQEVETEGVHWKLEPISSYFSDEPWSDYYYQYQNIYAGTFTLTIERTSDAPPGPVAYAMQLLGRIRRRSSAASMRLPRRHR